MTARWSVCLIALLALMGCTTSLGKFAFVGTEEGEDMKAMATPVDGGRFVQGESCEHQVFFVPVTDASIDRAYDNALRGVQGANAIAGVRVSEETKFVGLLYNLICLRVSGMAVKLR